MAQLRVRKKPTQPPRAGSTLVPMAVVLAAGIATTFLAGNSTGRPADLAFELAPVASQALEQVKAAVRPEAARESPVFEVEGRAWILADHPPVTAFTAAEMVEVATVEGRTLMANRRRGLAALGKPAAFDRLYLELAPGRYAPLRWRDVPTP